MVVLGGLAGLAGYFFQNPLDDRVDHRAPLNPVGQPDRQERSNLQTEFFEYAKTVFGLGLPPDTLQLRFGLDDVQYLDRMGNDVPAKLASQVVYSTPEIDAPDAVIRSYVFDDFGMVEAVLYYLGRQNPELSRVKSEFNRMLGDPKSSDPRLLLWQFEYDSRLYDVILKDATLTETYQENAWDGAELTIRRSGQ